MIKKFIIFLFIFFGFVANAYASSDDSMLAATVMFIKRGMITTPSWAKPIDDKKAFSQYDSKSNEIARFLICSHSSIDKYDNNGYDRLNEFYYNGGYIDLYNLDNNPKITAKFKFAGDTIYEYDNKPDKKKGILGALGFYEDGPGHLVAYAKISPDGILTKFDAFDNKITSFKFTDNKTIKQYDANGNSIGHYKLLKYNETFPKKESTPVNKANVSTELNSISIVPTLLLLAKEERLSNDNWNIKLKDIDSVTFYYNNTQKGRLISTSGGIYIYNNNGTKIGYLTATNSGVYFYNEQDKKCLYFSPTSNNIYIYDSYGNKIGELSFFGNNIYLYDTNNKVGEFSIVGGNIYQYNAQGKKIGEYILL